MRNNALYRLIAFSVFSELVCVIFLTILFSSDLFTNKALIASGYVYHRAALVGMCYLIAAFQVGFSFYTRMVRPETVLFAAFKTSIYLLFIVAIFLLFIDEHAIMNAWLLFLIPSLFVVMSIGRLMFRALLRYNRRKGKDSSVVCLIGNYENLHDVLQALADSTTGFSILGYYNETRDDNFPSEIKYLGTVKDFMTYASDYSCPIRRVFFASQMDNIQYLNEVASICDNHILYLYCMPMVHSILHRSLHMTTIGSTPLFVPREMPLQRFTSRFVKRTFDICFSGLFLCTLFPFVLLIFGTWIKLTSRGPIFFRQRRSGIDNREFWCYKFRSMAVNKDADVRQATKNDSRVTYVGRLMRKTSIDELPQFINVFLGDMSVVGPRPHMVMHTTMYREEIDKYMVRHFAKPGITGWAQVNGYRGETHELWQMEGRVKRDIWYIENWSFLLDVVIIFKTITNAIKGEEQAY